MLTDRLERSSPRYEGGVLPDKLGQRFESPRRKPATLLGLYRTWDALIQRAHHPDAKHTDARANQCACATWTVTVVRILWAICPSCLCGGGWTLPPVIPVFLTLALVRAALSGE